MPTIIGAGKMAHGIGIRLLAGGVPVTIVGRNVEKARAAAEQLQSATGHEATVQATLFGTAIADDVVILAIPYVAACGGDRNPSAVRATSRGHDSRRCYQPPQFVVRWACHPADQFGSRGDCQAHSQTKVVKAFSTIFARSLVAGSVAGFPLDVFLASDYAGAKARVAHLIQAGGLRAIDAGPLQRARQLEALGLLHITLQSTLGSGFGIAVKILV
jgi:predicted dinucleotide-binding enzyme